MGSVSDGVLHQELGALPLQDVVRVQTGSSLREAAEVLRQADVSSALVGESQRDMITERDLTQALADGRDAGDPIDQLVGTVHLWATTTSHVIDALGMMSHHGVRHLIVLSTEGKAVGVVSIRDLLGRIVPELEK